MTRLAIDAMGGDHAPAQIVLGAVDAAKEGHDVVLVGDPARIEPLLEDVGFDLDVVAASEIIGMGDDPTTAMRDKKDASILVAARLVANGEAVGVVSAGSTGATMAAAAFIIGRLPGVARPAIATLFPGGTVVLDSGANLVCGAKHLVQFGVMGAALAEALLGIKEPRVGLVNVGEEDGKGRDLEREAFGGLASLEGLNFVGNVEGTDIGSGKVDVLVTDGFTGNVLIKTAEGAARLVQSVMRDVLSLPAHAQAAAALVPAFTEMSDRVNPETYGGGHLLGTKGVVVIAHGSSSRVAMTNAIAMASEGASHGLVEKIATGLGAGAV